MEKKLAPAGQKYTVYVKTYTEYERGWGCRPDGASFHLTAEAARDYADDYNRKFNNEKQVPYEYTKPDDGVYTAEVGDVMYEQIQKKGHWLLWQMEFSRQRWPNGWTPDAIDQLNLRKL